MTQPKKLRWIAATALAAAAGGLTLAYAESGVADNPPSSPSAAEAARLVDNKQKTTTAPADQPAPHVTSGPRTDCPDDMPANVSVAWRLKPKNLAEVRGQADTIVLGEVVDVQQGADNVLANPNEPGGEVRTPTQVVTLAVKKSYKGPSRRGDKVTVAKLGGPCYVVDEDPAYKAGETHLLMLERGPRGHLQTVSPEGRYKQTANGTLEPVAADAVTAEARGKRADAVAR